ncbi:uncharacterized protein SPSC_04906 [Sporisorium scitamineum]|uniref:Uncharacterized protein n=1 Tax=Sporisorium scitamineum TaxID=49012 RepID=A0A0F7S475_9BASI|nr:uncharacterized protein SPSC_04906 [Sporisorium scitamineum]CDW97146.1 hypothetical protein [Sporisorium scitamineum]
MIDELIHSCIEQIGLDGEAGTDIDRFADFIRQYHSEHSSRSQLPDQLVDASYQAFVFRQLLGHPHIGVGLFVPGVPLQSGAKNGILKRKSSALDSPAARLKSESSTTLSPEFDSVELLPDQALAEQQGLAELQRIHGHRLRLVLQTSVIKRLLVGSESIFLPPSAFRVLQIICRSREKPVLSTDIGTTMHTDQKTVFYICKRLTDHHLVTKIKARETGTIASYFVATSFEDRCDILVQQRNADNAADLQQSSMPSSSTAQPSSSTFPSFSLDSTQLDEDNFDADELDPELDQDDDGDAQSSAAPTVTVKEEEVQRIPQAGTNNNVSLLSSAPVFERVDAAKALVWMNSRPELVRFRIYLICNSTPSKVTARLGLLHRINLPLARAKKRVFLKTLEHAVVDGFLEVVNISVSSTGRSHRGLRMTPKGLNEMYDLMRGDYDDASVLQKQVKAASLNAKLHQDLSRTESTMPREITLERHVHEQIARAGPVGRTISQLMAQLHGTGYFARALDQIAQRTDDADGEPSMSDLQVRSFHEHKLRVRSTKMYSYHAWVLQSANEGFLDPDDLQLLASAGGSSSYHRRSAAWTAPEQVSNHLASLAKDLYTPTPGKNAKRSGRPPKERPLDTDSDTPPPKRGRPRKRPLPNPDAPPPKRGRPRKNPVDPVEASPADTDVAQSPAPSTPRVRSLRSRKAREVDSPAHDSSPLSDTNVDADVSMNEEFTPAVPDSPAAGAASRRSSRRLIGRQGQTRTASLLSTPAVRAAEEEPVASQIEQDAVHEPPMTSPPPTQQQAQEQKEEAAPQEAAQSAPIQETRQSPEPPLVDVSRVDDLLSAPTEVKAEAQPVPPATRAVKKISDATATPGSSQRKSRTNLTQLRSSNALVQCIREAGGAMDALQIPDLLSDFVEKHGFASDAQLSDLRDRKVREKALVNAVDNNLLRRTFIRLDVPTAYHPRRQILYLPDLPQEQLQAYCDAVKQGHLGWTGTKSAKTALTNATDSVAIASIETLRFAKPWHLQDPLRLAELPQDDAQISMLRRSFRDVSSVYRQQFGFLSGEMLRLKAFHLACAKFIALRRQASSEQVHDDSLPLSFFWTDAPLDLILGLVPTPYVAESIETKLLDPQLRSTPVRALPEEVKASLGLSDRVADEVCVSIYSLATQLAHLGIVRIRAAGTPADTSSSSPDMTNAVVEPLCRLPLYDWTSEGQNKPLICSVEAGLDAGRINYFWARVQAICLNPRRKPTTEGSEDLRDMTVGDAVRDLAESGILVDMDAHKTSAEELSVVMHTHRTWRPYHQLRPSQFKFLFRIDLQDIPLATQADIDRLAYVTLAPQHVVRSVLQSRLERANEPVAPDAPRARRHKPRFTWPLMLNAITLPTRVYEPAQVNRAPRTVQKAREPTFAGRQERTKTQAERERQGRITTLTKARQLRQRREQDFQAMLEHAFQQAPAAHHLRAKIETALSVVRSKFVAGNVMFDVNSVQAAIQRAIRSASGLRSMPAVRAASGGRRKRQEKPTPIDPARDSDEEANQPQQADGDADTGSGKRKRDRRTRKLDQVHFWSPARKELLRDAAVILRVRDKVRGRSDWSALFQVIDRQEFNVTRGVIMAQWRGQYYRMQSQHGEESYLAALENRWIPVYMSARESGILQDDDFPAATGFDLVAQIELLREKIDKNEVQRSLTKPVARYHLPLQLGASTDFTTTWKDEFVHEPIERRFEAFFTGELGVTTRRFETLLLTAFGNEERAGGDTVGAKVKEMMAEWAVRIVIASAEPDTGAPELGATQVDAPPADEATKAEFCRGVGDAHIEEAMQRLLDAKLIRSITVDPGVRRKPGTNFVFTEELQKLLPDPSAANRLAGSDLQAILTHRRAAFQQICDESEGVMVEPVEADGEAAALLPLMEAGLISGEADGQAFEALRQTVALNARVLNDDDLEALITVKGQNEMMDVLDAAVVPLPAIPEDQALEWLTVAASGGVTKEDPLGARMETLLTMWQQRFDELVKTATDAHAARRLQDFGSRLISSSQGVPLDAALTHAEVLTLRTGPLPLAFFSPLTSRPILVASPFVGAYTLSIPSRTATRITLPHIWTSFTTPCTAMWRTLLDNVVSLTLQRPGLTVGWLSSRFSEEGKVVGVSFADVWRAVCCLLESGIVELRVGREVGVEGWTVHYGGRGVWAGFRG